MEKKASARSARSLRQKKKSIKPRRFNASSIFQEHGELFRLLINSVNDYAIFTMNPQGCIRSWNRGAERLFRYKKKKIIGKHFSEFFTSEDQLQKRPEEELQKAIRDGRAEATNWVVRHDTTRFFASSVTTALWNSDGKLRGFAKVVRDLSTLRHTEETLRQLETELRKSKEQLEVILESIADGISVQDAHGNVVYMNNTGAELCGFDSPQEALRKSKFSKKQGKVIQYEIQDEEGNPYPQDKLPCNRALRGEKNPQAIVQYYDKRTNTRRWSLMKARPIFDEKGKVQFAVDVFSDITQQYEMEKRKDEFISMASHELKTPVTSLKVYMEVLQKQLEKQSNGSPVSYLGKMHAQLDKLTKLIKDLLDISRIQTGKLEFHYETFPIDELIKEITDNVRLTTRKHTIVISHKANVLLTADRDRISQVLINLLTNAIKYSPQADKIVVAAKKDAHEAIVSVRDYGIGISKEHHYKIFERFYQIKGAAEKTFPGLGIGLHISNEIVKRHGGKLWVESAKGKGAMFQFALPLEKK